jgi:hypothetical protein
VLWRMSLHAGHALVLLMPRKGPNLFPWESL